MKHIFSKEVVPPGCRWSLKHPNNGVSISGLTWREFEKNVADYHRSHNWPVTLEFGEWIEQEYCQQNPNMCEDYVAKKRVPGGSMSFGVVLRGTETLLRFYAAGKPLVEKPVAEERAAKCLNCPMNRRFSEAGCGSCGKLRSAVMWLTGVERLPQLANRACNICGCSLEAAVWLPLDVQCPAVTTVMRQEFAEINAERGCWKTCE